MKYVFPYLNTTACSYSRDERKTNQTIPQWPILFYKPFTALNTPSDPIPISEGYQTQGNFTSEMDYETELVIVMKRKAFNISDEEALDHILGYTVGHDVSHRGWQIARGGQPQPQYSMGKGAGGLCFSISRSSQACVLNRFFD